MDVATVYIVKGVKGDGETAFDSMANALPWAFPGDTIEVWRVKVTQRLDTGKIISFEHIEKIGSERVPARPARAVEFPSDPDDLDYGEPGEGFNSWYPTK